MQEPSDSELLRQYAEQDSETAFETLVSRHINLVYSAALRKTGNFHAAEEVSQAVFIILAQKARALPKKAILSGWLYQAARLTAANFLRGEIRRARREQEADMQFLPHEPEIWPQIIPLLDDAMGRLSEKDRNALILRFFEGKNFQEIGGALGASENAAKKRVAYSLEKLRTFFTQRGVESTTDAIAGAISANSVQAAPIGMAKIISAAALAKGAVASTSTLTLVNGALKLMAWTKTKIAITTGIATVVTGLLLVGGGILIVKSNNAMQRTMALGSMQGNWEGTLAVGPAKLRLVLNIFRTNDTYGATLDSIDQTPAAIPVPTLSARPHFIQFSLPALDADFQGTLNPDGTAISGTFKQIGKSFPMTFTKTDNPDTYAAPLTPDSYTSRQGSDLQGVWKGALKVGKDVLHLNLKIAEPSPGTFQAQMDSVDQGAMNMPVTSLTYQRPAVQFQMDQINGSYAGNLSERGDELVGTWTQMGKKYPLTFDLARTNAPVVSDADKDFGSGAPNQIQGHWKGILKVGKVELHILFHIASMPDDSYSATMDSPDQGAVGIAASSAKFTYPNVRLTWNGLGYFAGTLNNGKLSGVWHQGKVSLPLKLQKDTGQ